MSSPGRTSQVDEVHFRQVAEAFTYKAGVYDAFGLGHPNLERMRHKVYAHVLRFAPSGARILELNAGTGADAAFLAGQGYTVHATDLAPGMLAAIQDKTERYGLHGKLTAQRASFTDLSGVDSGPFDYVLSNFGGLNCIPNLSQVARQLPELLRPGGGLTWVIMPPVCLWDLALVFQGKGGQAFKRLQPGGTLASVEGVRFKVFYFTPGQAMRALGREFHLLKLEGLSVFAPPADRKRFALRFPRLYHLLVNLDERLAGFPPFCGWGDFYILSAEYRP